ncbi:MAG TPA: carboxylesterase family protein, partial [Candidatus Acidoferrum sp.]|nr:carboxylesterase family protein [Candidatus Acidoferrum sp.]
AQLPQPVTTNLGLVQGESVADGKITVFRGLPYAAPPIGVNRWREPQAPVGWSGIRLADRFAPRCVQRGFAPGADQPQSSEDCLYLNIWTPATSNNAHLPVLVWLHGGGFFGGAGSDSAYDGTNLAKRGAVVVTTNYRLGIFGFLAHPELSAESPHHSSGNYALLDMIAALQWAQANVAAFGGDPANVTIVGESAGAQSVGVLVATSLTKGLFKRAILQSSGWLGFNINAMPTLAAREAQGVEQVSKFGVTSITELRNASTQQIFEKFPNNGAMVVDGYVLPKDASLIFAAGQQQPVDVLAGSNSNEAAFFGPGLQTMAALVDYRQSRFGPQAAAFARLYPFDSDTKAHDMYYKAFSAEMAWHVRRLVQYQHDRGQHAYAYYFSHVPPGGEARGATHVSELAYMFNQAEQNPKWTMADKKLSDQMAQYWVNFATTGNPNGKDLPEWPAYQNGKGNTVMGFGDQSAAMKTTTPSTAELDFFEKAYQHHLQTLAH